MKLRLAVALLVWSFGLTAQATDTQVHFPVPDSLLGENLNGVSISDFTFNGEWRNVLGEGPAIYEYANPHSLTYDLGSFTFKSMQLGGWPYFDYGSSPGASFTLQFQFLDALGGIIKTDSQLLSHDNTLINFSDVVSEVHSISFLPTGNGNFPRLDSLTISAVPEPGTYVMVLIGMGLIILRVRRGSANRAGQIPV